MGRQLIKLSEEEVSFFEGIVRRGAHTTKEFRAAYVLLNRDEGPLGRQQTYETISSVLRMGHATCERIVRKFVEGGWEGALERKVTARIYDRKVDGAVEAHIVRLACSEPPEGRSRWTLRLLRDRVVELGLVDYLSHVTIGEVLKKTSFSLGR